MSNRQIELETIDRIDKLIFTPVCPKYRSVQMAYATITYVLLGAIALFLLLLDSPWWCIAAEIVITVSYIINLAILRKAYRFKGYALREHDITYRSGVIFPKTTTVPFSKIQQVSISRNPVNKYFGLCSIDIVNGAQNLSALAINGLTTDQADAIKNLITQRLNSVHD